MTRGNDGGGVRRASLAAAALVLAILAALPAHGGDRRATRDRSGPTSEKRSLALSIRVAEARNKTATKRYLQSVARQQKAKRGRPVPGRRSD